MRCETGLPAEKIQDTSCKFLWLVVVPIMKVGFLFRGIEDCFGHCNIELGFSTFCNHPAPAFLLHSCGRVREKMVVIIRVLIKPVKQPLSPHIIPSHCKTTMPQHHFGFILALVTGLSILHSFGVFPQSFEGAAGCLESFLEVGLDLGLVAFDLPIHAWGRRQGANMNLGHTCLLNQSLNA